MVSWESFHGSFFFSILLKLLFTLDFLHRRTACMVILSSLEMDDF